MERRTKKYRQVSPERAKECTEKSHRNHHNHQHQQQHSRKVPVVYYLCRNQQLEHPHFMEVSLSVDDHLYLRDVIENLNVLRGRSIASMYSWSCKRSYKNGYVWNDLSDDDIIHPAHGCEYILKGSELFEESNSGRFNPTGNFIIQSGKALPELPSSRNKEESSSRLNGRTAKTFADASTQTEENDSIVMESRANTCSRGVSTDDGLSEPNQNQVSEVKRNPSLSGKIDTLESLIRADIRKLNSFRILEDEGFQIPSSTKIKVANMIMQLVSCGSITVKDHSLGFIPTYRSRISDSRCRSSLMLGEVDRTAENHYSTAATLRGDKHFSGSLAETSMNREDAPTAKQSSSCNADSCCNAEQNEIKIEERLALGARVTIRSKVSTDSEAITDWKLLHHRQP